MKTLIMPIILLLLLILVLNLELNITYRADRFQVVKSISTKSISTQDLEIKHEGIVIYQVGDTIDLLNICNK